MNDYHLEISRPCKDLYTSTDTSFFIVDISKAHILSSTHLVFERSFRVQKRRWFISLVFGFGFSVQWQNAIEQRSDVLLNRQWQIDMCNCEAFSSNRLLANRLLANRVFP